MGSGPSLCIMRNPDHYNIVVDMRKIMRCEEAGPDWQAVADPPAPEPPPRRLQCAHCKGMFPLADIRKIQLVDLIIYLCLQCKTAQWEIPA